mmetsp:Transcript_39820/g.104576  ORF Transcript_39820/g.104576 Transcript_39820/m.104576 type:complete len:282 (-) Transcript_39820:155-1000(-)
MAERAAVVEEERPAEQRLRCAQPRLVHVRLQQQPVASLVEPAHVLDPIGDGDETADDVAEARRDGGAGVAHRARPEGRVPLRHVDHAVDELEEGPAALERILRRESDREGQQRVVDVEVGLRVAGVVLEHGDRVRAQQPRVRHHMREQLRQRREELRLERAVEPLEHRRHVLDPRLADLVLARLGGGQAEALALRRRHHPVALLAREQRRLRHEDLLLALERRRQVVRRHRPHRVRRQRGHVEGRGRSAEEALARPRALHIVIVDILTQLEHEAVVALDVR